MTQKIAEYFKTQPVLKAWLFGSFARGEQRADSDVDILIVPDKMVGLFKLSGMKLDLQDILHLRVDLVTEKGLLQFARETVDRDKILIYERAAQRPQQTGAYKESHPEVAWRDISGMRNFLVHEYFRVDNDTVWAVIHSEIVELKEHIIRYLSETNWEEWEK